MGSGIGGGKGRSAALADPIIATARPNARSVLFIMFVSLLSAAKPDYETPDEFT
jgi:hypothetical protein